MFVFASAGKKIILWLLTLIDLHCAMILLALVLTYSAMIERLKRCKTEQISGNSSLLVQQHLLLKTCFFKVQNT